jgi:hypothetical protein
MANHQLLQLQLYFLTPWVGLQDHLLEVSETQGEPDLNLSSILFITA